MSSPTTTTAANSDPPTAGPSPPPAFNISYPRSLAQYHVSPSTYLSTHFPAESLDGLATAAFVFDHADRLLLLRRAQHDSMPGLWEPPGGAADEEDGSLFVACARELWEEAGLVLKRVVRVLSEGEGKAPGSRFTNRTGQRHFVKFGFEVEVASEEGRRGQDGEREREGERPAVRTDPNEHDAFVWVSEEEVRGGSVGGMELGLTYGGTREAIYDAFRRRREEEEVVVEEATEWAGKGRKL